MILKVKYFGMVAEALGKEAEMLDAEVTEVSDLVKLYESKLKSVSFKVAVNHSMVESNHQ